MRKEVICPHVIVMERDGKPCALLAARLEKTKFIPKIGYFKPIQIPATILTVIHQGLLGQIDEGMAKELVRHFWLLLSSKEADAIVFNQLLEDSPLGKALLINGPRWWCEKGPAWSTHWKMLLPEKFDFLQHKMGSKQRWKVRKRQRELESAFPGKVSWQWITSFDDVLGICARLEEVAARTYQRGLGAGFKDDEEHRRRLALFASRGQLRVQLLEVGESVRAFWIGTIYKGVFHSDALGYDPDFRQYEPGTLVFVKLADELTREGVKEIDFGLGDGVYKQRFGDESWRESTVRFFSPNLKGFYLRAFFGVFFMLDKLGRSLVLETGVLDKIKTLWRRRLETKNSEPDAE